MYISRVRLENIRGFHGARNVDLKLTRPDGSHAGWTVIAGRNGSGKTSLLRAIALTVSGPDVTRNLVSDFESWISTSHSKGKAWIDLATEPTVDVVQQQQGGVGSASFETALLWRAPEGSPTQSGAQPQILVPSMADTVLNQGPWHTNPRGWFCAAYGPFRRLAGDAGDRKTPSRVARLLSLFDEDFSLADGIDWLIGQHLRALEGNSSAVDLKESALRILADGLLPDDYQVCSISSEGLWVRVAGREFPLREMSDGYRTVAALVVDIMKQLYLAYGELSANLTGAVPVITAPGVVLIDEVDAHLHVSWQKRIGEWLKAHFPNIQFIVTSHSPYVCQAADPGGLIRLPGPEEETPPQVVEQDLYARIVYGSGDDAALSELFGLDSPYSERAEELRRQLVRLEMAVLGGEADDDQIAEYRRLRSLLTSSMMARTDEVAARLMSRGAIE